MPIINLSRITPYKALGIWKINESQNEINHLNNIEKLNIDNRILEKKFKEGIIGNNLCIKDIIIPKAIISFLILFLNLKIFWNKINKNIQNKLKPIKPVSVNQVK